MNNSIKEFFTNSDRLSDMVMRRLSFINENWELIWDHTKNQYIEEDNSFAKLFNILLNELSLVAIPNRYHENEDALIELLKQHYNWPVVKVNGRWIGIGIEIDYDRMLEIAGFHDVDQQNLLQAAAGRIKAAIVRNQKNFDEMEESHAKMLGYVLIILLYHRTS